MTVCCRSAATPSGQLGTCSALLWCNDSTSTFEHSHIVHNNSTHLPVCMRCPHSVTILQSVIGVHCVPSEIYHKALLQLTEGHRDTDHFLINGGTEQRARNHLGILLSFKMQKNQVRQHQYDQVPSNVPLHVVLSLLFYTSPSFLLFSQLSCYKLH